MKSLARLAAGVACLTILLTGASVLGAGAGIPEPVRRAAQEIFGKHAKIDHERENGQDEYEVSAGTEMEVVLDAAGLVKEVEIEIPVGLVPSSVRAEVERLLAGGSIDEAEIVIRDAELLYEVETKDSSGRETEFLLRSDGQLVSTEAESDSDEDDDED